MIIVFDTSELQADWALQSAAIEYLRAFAMNNSVRIVIPEIVRLEAEDHIRTQARAWRESARKLGRQTDGVIKWLVVPGVERPESEWERSAVESWRERLAWLGAEIVPMPLVTHDEIVSRLLRGLKPFGHKSIREVGYRDFLVWKTVVELSAQDRVCLVSRNQNDFSDGSAIHPDLTAELPSEVQVAWFRDLSTLVDSEIRPALPSEAEAGYWLAGEGKEALNALLRNQIEPEEIIEGLESHEYEWAVWRALDDKHGEALPEDVEFVGIDPIRLSIGNVDVLDVRVLSGTQVMAGLQVGAKLDVDIDYEIEGIPNHVMLTLSSNLRVGVTVAALAGGRWEIGDLFPY